MLPNNKNRFKLMLNKLATLVKEGSDPADVIRAILWLWMKRATPGVILSDQQATRLTKEGAVSLFAEWLGESEILIGAFWLSSAFAHLIAKEQRKACAMYFTPPYLSNRMIANAGDAIFTGKIVDPACGGAAFLAPAALAISKQMAAQGKASGEILSHIECHLYGMDTEPFLCELSIAFLHMVLADHIIEAGRALRFNVICADGLSALDAELQTFDLVLSNPPYRKMVRDEVKPLLPVYESVMSGQPNLYSVFIKRSSDLLKPDGRAVLLTPMSFLSGKSFSKLRHELLTNGRITQLDLIHDKQGIFLWAEQDTVVTVWEKGKQQNSPAAVNSLSRGGNVEFNGMLTLPNSDRPWIIPRNIHDAELLPLFSRGLPGLQMYGYRPKTGAIVVHRDKRNRYSSLAEAKASKAKKALPLLWQRDIGANGELKFDAALAVPDRFIDMGGLASASIIKRPAIAMQRVTAPGQPRRLICAHIPESWISRFGGVVGENHVCLIEQAETGASVDPALLCSILRTKTLDRLFRCISGATNVSSYELNNLPLPELAILKNALNEGWSIEAATRIGLGLVPNTPGEPK